MAYNSPCLRWGAFVETGEAKSGLEFRLQLSRRKQEVLSALELVSEFLKGGMEWTCFYANEARQVAATTTLVNSSHVPRNKLFPTQ